MPDSKSTHTCRICGNSTGNRSYNLKEMMFGLPEEYEYSECAACGCLQIVEIPGDMTKYYPESYYSFAGPVARASGRMRVMLARSRNRYYLTHRNVLGRFLHQWRPNEPMSLIGLANLQSASRILDVGCGAGAILCDLKEAGFNNLLGIDPFLDRDKRTSNGVLLRKISLHGIDGSWDLIMLHHSFEHMPDPAEQLGAVSRLLSPEGVCLIRIPTVTSYAWKHYRTNWSQLDPPRHFFVHSNRSLQILAGHAGLACERVIYDSDGFQFWGSEQVARGIPLESEMSCFRNKQKSIFTPAEMSAFEKRAVELNRMQMGDQAAYYLRKLDRTKVVSGVEGEVH